MKHYNSIKFKQNALNLHLPLKNDKNRSTDDFSVVIVAIG